MTEHQETCQYNPENTFQGLDIILPPELSGEIITETQNELLFCQLDMLLQGAFSETIESENLFLSALKIHLFDAIKSGTTLQNAFTRDLFHQAFFSLGEQEYNLFISEIESGKIIPVIMVNQIAINYSKYLLPKNTLWKSPKPQSRPDISQLIGTSIPLARYYEIVGFGEELETSLEILFSEKIGKEKLTEIEEEQVIKLLKFVMGVETFGGKNIVLEDNIARPSGFYQFQVDDGSFGKEEYDFETQTWKNDGKWESGDEEIKIMKGDDKKWIRRIRKYSSYEQALISLPDELRIKYLALLEQEKTIGNPSLQHPEKLTHEEQTLLFLSNIISKGGEKSQELFKKILSGDDNAIIELYREIHHADKNREDTLKTVQRVATEIGIVL